MRTTEQVLQEYGCKNDNDSVDKADAKSAMREFALEAIDEVYKSAKITEGPHYGGHGPEYYTGIDYESVVKIKNQLL